MTRRSLPFIAAALLGACGGQAPEPAAAPPVTKAPAPKPPVVKFTAFAAPILEGKLDAWKSFVADIQGPRAEEWNAARAASGLTRETVWHQSTPGGDFAVVYQEAADVSKVMAHFAASSEQIDQDFVAMLRDVHGMDLSQPMPANKLLLSYTGSGERHQPYAFLVPIAEGKEDAANALTEALAGPRKAEFEESLGRAGVDREYIWRQGNALVAIWESAAPDQVMPARVASTNEFDTWFLDQISDFTGQDMREPRQPNTLAFDWQPAEVDESDEPTDGDDAAGDAEGSEDEETPEE